MRRMICIALFGMLISTDAAFSQHRHWAHPHGRVFIHGPEFRSHHGLHHHRYYFDAFRFFVQDFTTVYAAAPALIVPPAPTYLFLATASARRPQLIFKDGTTYMVADYWRVDDQLHFITSEEGGTKSVPHTVPFGDLDVQRTTDLATAQGFRFVLRDEPIEQWLKHHPRQTSSTSKSKRRTRERSD